MLEEASLPSQPVETQNLTAIEQQLQQLQLQVEHGQEQISNMLNHLPEATSSQPQTDLTAQFDQLKQGQDKLMAQMKSLSSQLAPVSATSLANHSANDASNQETPSLETQLERARRVKSKGLW